MKLKPLVNEKADSSLNPLWVIAVAMAIFFVAATAILSIG